VAVRDLAAVQAKHPAAKVARRRPYDVGCRPPHREINCGEDAPGTCVARTQKFRHLWAGHVAEMAQQEKILTDGRKTAE
jgi:hypothetical protein